MIKSGYNDPSKFKCWKLFWATLSSSPGYTSHKVGEGERRWEQGSKLPIELWVPTSSLLAPTSVHFLYQGIIKWYITSVQPVLVLTTFLFFFLPCSISLPFRILFGPCPVLHICEVTRSISIPLVIYVQYTQSVSSGPYIDKSSWQKSCHIFMKSSLPEVDKP